MPGEIVRLDHRPSQQEVQEWLRRRIGSLLGTPPGHIALDQTFVSMGLSSRQAVELSGELEQWLGRRLSPTLAYEHHNLKKLSQYLAGAVSEQPPMPDQPQMVGSDEAMAIIGIGCRFPGAQNPDEYWQLLKEGRCQVQEVPPDRWNAAAFFDADPAAAGKMTTRVGGFLTEIDQFDPHFFGISPREAEGMDPQQRLLLEVAWEAMEDAGIAPARIRGSRTGVFIGISSFDYALREFEAAESIDPYTGTGNALSIAANRLSFRLDLKGPSLAIDTACSSSLIAVHLACQSIRRRECSMALVGGVNVILSPAISIGFSKSGLLSPSGCCRSFAAQADGYVRGEGAGAVLLKPLHQAQADQDPIYAVLLGSAINHNGQSNGLTAPSRQAQEALLREAYLQAKSSPSSVQYIEAHGSGTPLGDVMEAAALGSVVREGRHGHASCRIGSVKTNLGHLEAAAGIASLIKVALMLKHRTLVPSLHYERPNPDIPFKEHRIEVVTKTQPWQAEGTRIAGVSSFGFGGSNAHVVLQAAPEETKEACVSKNWQLLVFSGRSDKSLDALLDQMATFLEGKPDSLLGDVALSLQTGRDRQLWRRVLVADTLGLLRQQLANRGRSASFQASGEDGYPSVAFMLPGVGDHYVGMARGIYESEPIFRGIIDQGFDFLKTEYGLVQKTLLYPEVDTSPHTASLTANAPALDLRRMLRKSPAAAVQEEGALNSATSVHPTLFLVEIALAKLLMSWGLRPSALIGHSLGEYAAACLAGVFSQEDALRLVVERARLIEALPPGGMLAVPLPADQVRAQLDPELDLAVQNSPCHTVVSGPVEKIREQERCWREQKIASLFLPTAHPFHSRMLQSIQQPLEQLVKKLQPKPPGLPLVSNLTGQWLTAVQAMTPGYWAEHMCRPVLFDKGLELLLADPNQVLLEVGPGHTLSSFALQALSAAGQAHRAFPTIRHHFENQSDRSVLLQAIGELWLRGADLDWGQFHHPDRPRRMQIPTTPFERQRCWMQHREKSGQRDVAKGACQLYVKNFKQMLLPQAPDLQKLRQRQQSWLLLGGPEGLAEVLGLELMEANQKVLVASGHPSASSRIPTIPFAPDTVDGYRRLLRQVKQQGAVPANIVHLMSLGEDAHQSPLPRNEQDARKRGFSSLVYLAQALAKEAPAMQVRLWVVSNDLVEVESKDAVSPEKATMMGPALVVHQEYPEIQCRVVDAGQVPQHAPEEQKAWIANLLAEFAHPGRETMVALRNQKRWVPWIESVGLDQAPAQNGWLKNNGTYFISGGLGRIGLLIAEWLATLEKVRLVLCSRRPMPPRQDWERTLAQAPDLLLQQQIASVCRIEAMGSEVWTVSADVADQGQMARVETQVRERFGLIQGLFHAAGVVDPAHFRTIAETDDNLVEAHFRSKVHGTKILDAVFREHPLDFCLALSSISAFMGGLGFSAYSAANNFLDAFCIAQRSRGSRQWLSVDWEPQQNNLQTVSLLEPVLSNRAPWTWIVAGPDLVDRWQQWTWVRSAAIASSSGPSRNLHPRPQLDTPFTAPASPTEKAIADICQELLGVTPIGAQDHFFKLGGNSLMGAQLVSRLRAAFEVDVPLRSLFSQPTVAGLALIVEDLLIDKIGAQADEK